MTKFLVGLIVALGICLGLSLWSRDGLIKENTRLEEEKSQCLKDKEGYKNAQMASSKLVKELRTERVKQSADVDCYNFALPEYVTGVFEQLK